MRLTRLLLAGALAGTALLGTSAQAEAPDCWNEPCYQCFMYPCGPKQWAEFLGDRACTAVRLACP